MSGKCGTLLLLATLALAVACAKEPDPPSAPTSGPAAADEAPAIRLLALTATDREAFPLAGELGCNFTTGTETLLVAAGDVADEDGHAQALVKIDAGAERMTARATGGFDGLPDGGVFAGIGITATVTRTSDTPNGAGESPPYPAELLLRSRAGTRSVIAGLWTCGP